MGTDSTSKREMDDFLDGLLAKMSLAEKLGQINLVTSNVPVGDNILADIRDGKVGGILGGLDKISFGVNGPDGLRPAQEAALQSRLGIPLLLAFDVIHGHQSVFPIPLALSCAWDMERVRATARFAAREASASGLNWVFSPMVDIGRDPRWGRIAEGSGEDPFLGSDIARAMIEGLQGQDLSAPDSVMACVKHFVGYGAPEAGRDYNNADMSPTRLHDVYLPPFKAAVDAGAASAMMSFSAVNGMPSHADSELLGAFLGGVLKVSDFDGIPELIAHGLGDEAGRIDEADPLQTLSERALRAGVQMDMMGWGFIHRLEKALAEGRVSQAQIDSACRAVLEAKYKLGLFADPFARFDPERAKRDVLAPEYAAAARETAAECCVLLKNHGGLLPLSKTLGSVAVIGPLADDTRNITGPWAFQGDPAHAVSVLDGIRAALGNGTKVRHAKGANITENRRMVELLNFAGPKVDIDPRPPAEMMAEAIAIAQESEVVIAVLGEAAEMSGEAASRLDIGIPDNQRDLLKALVGTGKKVVLVLMHGRPLTLPWENDHVPAILATWFGGHQAGPAIADLLFGDKVPSGKLTTSWPHHVGQVPIPYDRATTGRPGNPKEDPGKYTTRCYLDGSSEPLFPFGFGLSYTHFVYGAPQADKVELGPDDMLTITVSVSNHGKYAGQEIVQLYLTDPVASRVRPSKQLRGYAKLALQPGETKTARFTLSTSDLEFHDGQLNRIWEPGRFVIGVGPNSRDLQNLEIRWHK